MFTHVVMAVSVAALLLTAAVLLSLRSLKSNMRAIHANVAAALGVAELLFLLGIHRTHNQVQGWGQGTCVSMALPGSGSPGAKAQGQGSGMLRLGPGFGARCWVKVLWFRGRKRGEAGVALTPPNPAFSWCALRSPSSCTTSSSAPSRGSLCRGCTSTACRLSPATWTAAPCASTTPWAGASLPCCWVRALLPGPSGPATPGLYLSRGLTPAPAPSPDHYPNLHPCPPPRHVLSREPAVPPPLA